MWTTADLAELEAAIKGRVKRVSVGDETVEYQSYSLKEMLSLRDVMRRELSNTPRVYRARRGRE